MKRVIGLLIGLGYLVLAFLAYARSAAGWAIDAPDLGFWWAVVGSLLLLAGGAALVGTLLHTRSAAH